MGAGKSRLSFLEGVESSGKSLFSSTSESEATPEAITQVNRFLGQIQQVSAIISSPTRPSFATMVEMLQILTVVLNTFKKDTRYQGRLDSTGVKGQNPAGKPNGFPSRKPAKGPAETPMRSFSPNFGAPERSMQFLLRAMCNSLMDSQEILKTLFDTNPQENSLANPKEYHETREEIEIVMRHHLRTCLMFESAVLDCYDRAHEEAFARRNATLTNKPLRPAAPNSDPLPKEFIERNDNRPSCRWFTSSEMQSILSVVKFDLSRVLDHAPAQAFWDKNFGKEVFAVTKSHFLQKLRDDHPDLYFDDVDALIDPSCDNVVSLSDFRSFLEYFGPFPKCLSNANEILLCPWFYGSLSSSSAEQLLADAPIGSFLCHFCAQTPGRFTILCVEMSSTALPSGGINPEELKIVKHYHTSIDKELRPLLVEKDPPKDSIKELILSYSVSFRWGTTKCIETQKTTPAPAPSGSLSSSSDDVDLLVEQVQRLFIGFKGREHLRTQQEEDPQNSEPKKPKTGGRTPLQHLQPQNGMSLLQSASNWLLTPKGFQPAGDLNGQYTAQNGVDTDSECGSSASVPSESPSFVLTSYQDGHDYALPPVSRAKSDSQMPKAKSSSSSSSSAIHPNVRNLLEAAHSSIANRLDNDEKEND